MIAHETVFPPNPAETDITDETYFVSNGEFLLAVLGDELADARPVVVSFDGNPANVPTRSWFGVPWSGNPNAFTSLSASANNYFSLAVFRPDEAGRIGFVGFIGFPLAECKKCQRHFGRCRSLCSPVAAHDRRGEQPHE